MNETDHEMVRGGIPLMVHLIGTSAPAFPATLEQRQELASRLLTTAGADTVDFINIQGR